MKFLLFADYHHYPKYYLNHGIEGIRKFQRIAEEKGCDMILHLGDFCHGASTVKEFVDEYNNFHIPSYHCLGNHDAELCPPDEVVKAYKMPSDYYFFDKGGYRFIIVNTNYFYDKDKDEYIQFNQTNYYGVPTRETIPPKQVEWIRESIESSPYPCIICSHASFERLDSVKNREEVIEIIDEANRKKPHSVIMCMNGHHHRDHIAIMNNVIYYDVTSSIFDIAWSPPREPHDKFNKEDYEEYNYAGYIICTDEPLYSVVTIEGTTITIEGCEPTTMHCGVTQKDIGMREYDLSGRKFVPYTTSAKITIE